MKKRILLIIALVMIISTIIRTSIIGYTFWDYANSVIRSEVNTFRNILKVSDKQKTIIELIKSSKDIQEIRIINKPKYRSNVFSFEGISKNDIHIKLDLSKKEIIANAPLEKGKYLEIVFSGNTYYQKLVNSLIQLIVIAVFSLLVIIAIVNHFLNPYLEILEKIKIATVKILQGDFNVKLDTKLNGEAKEFVESFNNFIEALKENFKVIQEKYLSLIDKENQYQQFDKRENPLKEAKEAIEILADIFRFKKLIEEDETVQDIFKRIEKLLKQNNIKDYTLLGVDNLVEKIVFQKITSAPYCDVVKSFKHCRAYRTKKVIDSIRVPEICTKHGCEKCEHICIPFSKNGNFTGILKINSKTKEEAEKIEKISPFLKVYLDEASSILEAKYTLELLHMQTVKDPLTGLYNRKYLEEIMPVIIGKAERSKEKIGFLMLDMDKFKSINDTYGHKAGDLALKAVADVIRNSIRKSDIAIRYGGEEFLVILQDIKNKENLKKVAEKIRTTMEKTKINIESDIIQKTISIGGSLYNDDDKDGWVCVKKADEMLYKAKNEGRNKTILFNEKDNYNCFNNKEKKQKD